jgi:hypothetical protein
MKKEPKLSDFISNPISIPENGISWHIESIKKDLINNSTANEFYQKLGDDFRNSLKKYINENIPLDSLIEEFSNKVSSIPAIDFEDEANQMKNENVRQSDIIKWRIDKFWRPNVKNILEAILKQAETIYRIEKNKYDEYVKYYSKLSDDEKKEDDKQDELFGLH